MQLIPPQLLGFLAAGAICSFVDALLGMGYGVSSSTILITMGVTPAVVSASVHMVKLAVGATSAISHFRLNNVEKASATPLLISGAFGAVLGAYSLASAPKGGATLIVTLALLFMGAIITCRYAIGSRQSNSQHSHGTSWISVSLFGFTAGFLDAMGGGGWGPICTSYLMLVGYEPKRAVGTVNFAESFVAAATVAAFTVTIGIGSFLWCIAIPMIIGGVLVTPAAAYLCSKVPRRVLGVLIGLWIIALNLRLLVHLVA